MASVAAKEVKAKGMGSEEKKEPFSLYSTDTPLHYFLLQYQPLDVTLHKPQPTHLLISRVYALTINIISATVVVV